MVKTNKEKNTFLSRLSTASIQGPEDDQNGIPKRLKESQIRFIWGAKLNWTITMWIPTPEISPRMMKNVVRRQITVCVRLVWAARGEC